MDYKLKTTLTSEADITLDHDALRSVDYDFEELIIDIHWYVELTQNSRKNNIEINVGITKVFVDAKIYEIDTQKWRYIDEKLYPTDLTTWDVDISAFETDLPFIFSITDIALDFENKLLTIN